MSTPDPNYRYYNCNLQCPKLITKEFQATTASFNQWQPSGIGFENGFLDYNTTFNIAPNALQQSTSCGELTLYMKNTIGTQLAAVLMIIVSKTGGTITQALPYQTVSNFGALNVAILNNTTIQVTCSPAALCRWIWRGI
jgi:hypothetical protein